MACNSLDLTLQVTFFEGSRVSADRSDTFRDYDFTSSTMTDPAARRVSAQSGE